MTIPGKVPSALADGFFVYAEKHRFGFEDIVVDKSEALSLYKQAANLGHGRADLRLGEMFEQALGYALSIARWVEWQETALPLDQALSQKFSP